MAFDIRMSGDSIYGHAAIVVVHAALITDDAKAAGQTFQYFNYIKQSLYYIIVLHTLYIYIYILYV